MLSNREAHWLLIELCEKGGYCLRPEVRERLQNAPPKTAAAFADAVIRAEGLDPELDTEQYRSVLEYVERAFQRSSVIDKNR